MKCAFAFLLTAVLLCGQARAEVGSRVTRHVVGPTPVNVGSSSGRWLLELRTANTDGDAFCGPAADAMTQWPPIAAGQPLSFGVDSGYRGRSTAEQIIQCRACLDGVTDGGATCNPATTPIPLYAVEQGDLPDRSTPTHTPTVTPVNTIRPTHTPTPTQTFTPTRTFTPTPTQTPTATPSQTPTPT